MAQNPSRMRELALPARAARLLAVALLIPLVAPGALRAQPTGPGAEPPLSDKPVPMIEAGMHTAIIRRIGVDRAGRWAVTASDDKTARLWNLQTGRQERVLRLPVGPEAEGKLFAAALSPDGAVVALGGFTSPDGLNTAIYLLDRASGRLLQRLPGLPNVVNHLAFSPDGRRLAAALHSGGGVQVFERGAGGRWQLLAADGFDRSSYSVAFAADGRLLATVYPDPSSQAPGELRLYAPPTGQRLVLLQRRTASGGKRPYSARFSPDGRRIAVGFADTTAVDIVDGTSLAPLASADRQGLLSNGDLSKVAWSADGRRLLAAGRGFLADGSKPLMVWPAGGGAPRPVPLGLTNTVMDLQPLADGRLVFAGGDPAWGVLGPDLRHLRFWGPPVLDHRSDAASSNPNAGYDAFRLAPDGRWLEFRAVARTGAGSSRLARFDLQERRLSFPAAAAADGLAPRRSGLPIEGWYDTTRPTLAGQPLPLSDFEPSHSLAVAADGQRFALGSEWAVRLFDRGGRQLWRTSVPGVAWLVNLSPDGRSVLAALGDGSIRWYRSSDGTEALALFVHPDGRWLLWTPEGFYDASPATTATPGGGASLLGYHLNQGRDREASFVSAAQLEQNFFRPDLVARRLAGDEAPIAAAVAQVGDVRQLLRASALPPQIRLIGTPQRLASGEIEITYELIDQGGGIGPVELRVNGAVIEGRANPPVAGINRQRLALPSGKVRARLLAYGRGAIASLPLEMDLEGPSSAEPTTLHVLAVGVTAYRDGALRRGVRFAADDARAISATLSTAGRASTARVAPPVLLTDEQATGARIRQELQAMAGRVRPADLFVLYMAGHGMGTDQGEYVFLPQDLLYRNSASLAEGLGGSELRTLLARIPSSKTVVVLDTCSSGTFSLSGRSLGEKGAIDRLARLSGRVVLAAAGDQRMALENPDKRHGIYTGALLRALAGQADANRDGQVGVREVADYVEREVQRITLALFNEEQTPMSDLRGQNFPLSRSGSP